MTKEELLEALKELVRSRDIEFELVRSRDWGDEEYSTRLDVYVAGEKVQTSYL